VLEHVQGSSGWGGVVLDCNIPDVVLELLGHVVEVGERYRYAGGYVEDGFGCAGTGKWQEHQRICQYKRLHGCVHYKLEHKHEQAV
jgi:hypothetical protein